MRKFSLFLSISLILSMFFLFHGCMGSPPAEPTPAPVDNGETSGEASSSEEGSAEETSSEGVDESSEESSTEEVDESSEESSTEETEDSAEGDSEVIALASEMLDAIIAGDYEKATENFDDAMKEQLSPEALKEVWEKQLVGAAGAFKEKGEAVQKQVEEGGKTFECVVIKCEFEKMPLFCQVAFDSENKVAGLYFKPEDNL